MGLLGLGNATGKVKKIRKEKKEEGVGGLVVTGGMGGVWGGGRRLLGIYLMRDIEYVILKYETF